MNSLVFFAEVQVAVLLVLNLPRQGFPATCRIGHCCVCSPLLFASEILCDSPGDSPTYSKPGLKITASQRTMSGLMADLPGQTLVSPVILTGHFWMRTFYNIFHIVVAQCVLLHNAVMIFFFGFFCCFALTPLKKKNPAINFMSSCHNETQQSKTTSN